MAKADDYEERQRICPHCKQGTTFVIKEIGSKLRAKSPMADPNQFALMVALVCILCEKISLYTKESMSSVFTFVPLEEKKRKTTKRIA